MTKAEPLLTGDELERLTHRLETVAQAGEKAA